MDVQHITHVGSAILNPLPCVGILLLQFLAEGFIGDGNAILRTCAAIASNGWDNVHLQQHTALQKGVVRTKIMTREELLKYEPSIPDWSIGGLYMGTGGITCPHKMTIALAENAAENGAEKIVPKTAKLYTTADNFKDVTVAHYESTPEILLIDTETMCHGFIDAFLGTSWSFSYEETETALTITRENGAYCEIDFVEDTMYFNDFDMFTACGYGNMADMLDGTYVDAEGNGFYFQRTSSLSISVTVHLISIQMISSPSQSSKMLLQPQSTVPEARMGSSS